MNCWKSRNYAVIRLKYFNLFKKSEFYFERIDFALANQLSFFFLDQQWFVMNNWWFKDVSVRKIYHTLSIILSKHNQIEQWELKHRRGKLEHTQFLHSLQIRLKDETSIFQFQRRERNHFTSNHFIWKEKKGDCKPCEEIIAIHFEPQKYFWFMYFITSIPVISIKKKN